MLITIAIFINHEWNQWKTGIIKRYYKLQKEYGIDRLQINGTSYLKQNHLSDIIKPDRIHSQQVIKRIAQKLPREERLQFLFKAYAIISAPNLEEGMKKINALYTEYHDHKQLFIRTKMELFRQPHWIKHTYAWAKYSSPSESMLYP